MNWRRGLGFVFLGLALLILIDTLLSLSGLLNESTNLFRDVMG
jgi:Na+-transporting methylmalonyl-CoA/oxaloacetate decarboxylase gamma subunit